MNGYLRLVKMDVPFTRQMGNKSSHALKLQQHLHDQMMSQSDFCDVTLMVKDVEIKAHWNVLVSCPYFQSLYDSGLAEKLSGTVKLHIGKPAAVRSAISFLYMGMVEVNYENVKDLLEVADYFQIMDLKRTCQDYLYSVNIKVDNCVQICLLCSLYDLELYTRAFDFLRGNLPEVMKTDDILTLTHESVMSLLTDSTLCYVSQVEFYHFILCWIKHDPENRDQYFEEQFCTLNLKKISRQFLEDVIEQNELVRKHEKCKVHVLNVKMKYMAGLISEDSGMRDIIIVAGGCGHGVYLNNLFHLFPFSDCISVSNVYGYIVQEERWIELPPLPEQMRKPYITYDPRGYMYVFNTNSTNYSSLFLVFKLNIQDKTWTSFRMKIPDTIANVSIQNLVSCNGVLYAVVSGTMQNNKTPSIEEWQTALIEVKEDGTDSEIRSILFPRNANTQINTCIIQKKYVCVLAWKHGIKCKKSRQLSKFFMYDTEEHKTTEHSKSASWEPVMVPVGEKIVVCRIGKYAAKTYTPPDTRWRSLKELMIPHPPMDAWRTDYSSLSDGQNFYMLGGKDPSTKKPLDTAFRYNFGSKKWTKLENMPQGLMQSAVCIVKMPTDHVRCHIECPHCLYHTRKSQAVYDVECPYDDVEEDTDYDYSYDDDDEEIASDHWEDYFDYYDAYEDWY